MRTFVATVCAPSKTIALEDCSGYCHRYERLVGRGPRIFPLYDIVPFLRKGARMKITL